MDYAAHVEEITQTAVNNLLRTVRAMPPERLTWKPEGNGRSALEILQDAAGRTGLFYASVWRAEAPEITPEVLARVAEQTAQWDSVDKCEAQITAGLEDFFGELRRTDDFSVILNLPYGGHTMSKKHFALMPYQSFYYWSGQINYIQTLYGDFERH